MYNASDTKHIRRQVKAAKASAERDRGVLQSIMYNTAGRTWMHDLLERCHVFHSSYSDKPLAMAYSEGERNIGLQLFLGIVQLCPDQYLQMMGEAYARSTNDNGQRGPGPDPRWDTGEPVNDVASEYDPTADDDA